MSDDLNDLKREAKTLVAQYCLQGLEGMNLREMQLLLSEKELMLSSVSERCSQATDLYRNVILKRVLEYDVREIGQAMNEATTPKDRHGALVRATFDAHVDLLFVETQPEWFKEMPVDDKTMGETRFAFKQHMEQHWAEWKAMGASESVERLDDMLMDYHDQLNALGLEAWRQEKGVGAISQNKNRGTER